MKAYDQAPYQPNAFPATRLGRLGAIARLQGLDSAPPDQARVLEIGCAQGLNLVGQAACHPGSEFIGLDSSGVEIDQGQRLIRRMGLDNLRLVHQNLQDFSDPGRFDYILVHGVFSWVADEVKEAIFTLCRRLLSPGGVAYVSYNAYPGWYGREALRELLALDNPGLTAPQARLDRSRQTLGVLHQAWLGTDQAYARLMLQEVDRLRRQSPSVLLHDELGEINDPCYFIQFVTWAAEHGLAYLADADRPFMSGVGLSAPMTAALRQLSGDRLQQEQCLDFLVGRAFRCSLLYGSDQAPLTGLRPELLETLFISAPVRCEQDETDQYLDFRTGCGLSFKTSEPFTMALIQVLAQAWPLALSWPELCAWLAEGLRQNELRQEDEIRLQGLVLELIDSGVVEIGLAALPCAGDPGPQPQAWLPARQLAEAGLPVVNPYNMIFALNESEHRLLRLLDGRRTVRQLATDLVVLSDEHALRQQLSALASKGLLIDNA